MKIKRIVFILVLLIFFYLPSSAFANIDFNAIYDEKPDRFTFYSNDTVYETKQQLSDFAKNNNEILQVNYFWKSTCNGMRYDVDIVWRPSVKMVNNMPLTTNEIQIKKDAEKVLESLNVSNLSDYQKVYEIYHWIQDKTDYDYEAAKRIRYRVELCHSDNINGVLYDGKAVCSGYSDAFYYMTNYSGVECKFVTDETHCWNMVKLRDKWYYIDVTDESGRCFLRGTDWATKNGYVATSYIPNEVSKFDYCF